jgi:hypothetical protein
MGNWAAQNVCLCAKLRVSAEDLKDAAARMNTVVKAECPVACGWDGGCTRISVTKIETLTFDSGIKTPARSIIINNDWVAKKISYLRLCHGLARAGAGAGGCVVRVPQFRSG